MCRDQPKCLHTQDKELLRHTWHKYEKDQTYTYDGWGGVWYTLWHKTFSLSLYIINPLRPELWMYIENCILLKCKIWEYIIGNYDQCFRIFGSNQYCSHISNKMFQSVIFGQNMIFLFKFIKWIKSTFYSDLNELKNLWIKVNRFFFFFCSHHFIMILQ